MSSTITHIRGPVATCNNLAAQSMAQLALDQGLTVYGNSAFCGIYDGRPRSPILLQPEMADPSSSMQMDQPCVVIFDQLDLATIVLEALRSVDMSSPQVLLMHQLANMGAHLVLVYLAVASVDPAVLPTADVLIDMRGMSTPPFLVPTELETTTQSTA
ncbi:hypothetical protein HAP94_25875 [Acidithiobacillus ferrivorans]|nr:hypothetical protein [Acidithiobacillus ferrivorans]